MILINETSCKSELASILEFEVVDSSHEVETKAKAFASIAIALTQDTKDFQFANDVLDQDTNFGKGSIVSFLFRIQ